MSIYAIGDIQGCFKSFQHLLEKISFNPEQDRLWLVGDIVNRGTGSLEVLRWAYQHQTCVDMVLGNHDLHTLVVAEGFVAPHRSDTLSELLAAPDRDELLHWLRHQHLAFSQDGYLMVHAGVLPQWDAADVMEFANEVETALRGADYRDFLRAMYGNFPSTWSDDLTGFDRLRMITNALTRLRVCSDSGEMDFKFKGKRKDIPAGLMPWFDVPARKLVGEVIIFGHWSALGLLEREHFFALDTGCLWGGKLTALRLGDHQVFQVPCDKGDQPANMVIGFD